MILKRSYVYLRCADKKKPMHSLSNESQSVDVSVARIFLIKKIVVSEATRRAPVVTRGRKWTVLARAESEEGPRSPSPSSSNATRTRSRARTPIPWEPLSPSTTRRWALYFFLSPRAQKHLILRSMRSIKIVQKKKKKNIQKKISGHT